MTRLDGSSYVLSAHVIETVEATPDTVVRLVSGKTLVVRERVDEVVDRVVAYRRRILGKG